MPIKAQRRLEPTNIHRFGCGFDAHPIPDLTAIQTASYEVFQQADIDSDKRKEQGLEGVLQEIFPVESYDKQLTVDYLGYDLGKPRYTPEECRQLRLTYGRPFKVRLRLNKE